MTSNTVREISADEIEIRAIRKAYDALKCLDMAATQRALAWLESKFHDKFTVPKRPARNPEVAK